MRKVLITQVPRMYNKERLESICRRSGVRIDCVPFTLVRPMEGKHFDLTDCISSYKVVIFVSYDAVEQYFKWCKEMNVFPNKTTRFICFSEPIAAYLMRFIGTRKRGVFAATDSSFPTLRLLIKKFRNERFLYPCSQEFLNTTLVNILERYGCNYRMVAMYHITANPEAKKTPVEEYDIIGFFSTSAMMAFRELFPDYPLDKKIVGVYGATTLAVANAHNIPVHFFAPSKQSKSLFDSLDHYLKNEK